MEVIKVTEGNKKILESLKEAICYVGGDVGVTLCCSQYGIFDVAKAKQALTKFQSVERLVNQQLFEKAIDAAYQNSLSKGDGEQGYSKEDLLVALKTFALDVQKQPKLIDKEACLSSVEIKEWGYLKEQTAEQREAGYWFPCSGCYEDGEYGGNNSNYHDSVIFNSKMGCGCQECGGIGVVFDNTDYEKLYGEKSAADESLTNKTEV